MSTPSQIEELVKKWFSNTTVTRREAIEWALKEQRSQIMAAIPTSKTEELEWCEECNFPLSPCGEQNVDGTPSMDCKVCQLRDKVAQLTAARASQTSEHEKQVAEWNDTVRLWNKSEEALQNVIANRDAEIAELTRKLAEAWSACDAHKDTARELAPLCPVCLLRDHNHQNATFVRLSKAYETQSAQLAESQAARLAAEAKAGSLNKQLIDACNVGNAKTIRILALEQVNEAMRNALDAKIQGNHAEPYFLIQFPAMEGHIPAMEWFANLRRAATLQPSPELLDRIVGAANLINSRVANEMEPADNEGAPEVDSLLVDIYTWSQEILQLLRTLTSTEVKGDR
jgi:hypothetical protein